MHPVDTTPSPDGSPGEMRSGFLLPSAIERARASRAAALRGDFFPAQPPGNPSAFHALSVTADGHLAWKRGHANLLDVTSHAPRLCLPAPRTGGSRARAVGDAP